MRKILVPTDFSDNALTALNYAIELAKAEKAKLVLLHVYHVEAGTSFIDVAHPEPDPEEEERKWIDRLKSLKTRVDHAGQIDCELVARLDLAVDGIVREAEERDVDLIVMGTHGAGGVKGALFGTIAARVIERAGCPVIAIPEGASYYPARRITYACNYNKSELEALEKLVEMARPLRAQVNVLHISGKDEQHTKEDMLNFMCEVENKIVYSDLSFELLPGKDVEEKLEEYLKAGSTDLLVLSTHKRDFYDKIFGHSITRNLVQHSKVPVMAFHYKAKESVMLI